MTGEEASTSAVSKKAPSYLPLSSPPSECPTPAGAEANAMLAKEMNQLSAEEREKMLEDVHGIARVMDEPQEFIEASLALLEKELTNISNKVAYDLASSMSKKYTSSKKRRLMFLRAESFDAYNAASRMVRFFDQKYELFGPHNLTKDITLDDLDPDDIAALEKGFYQVLPEKDRAGRLVFCYFPKLKMIRTTQNMLRIYYYILMKSVEDDEEVQKRGVVACAYSAMDGCINVDPQLIRKTTKLRNALPARFNSIHACYNDLRLYPFFSLAMLLMRTHSRMRFRTHYGSHEECQSQLSSFGIPISALPVSPQGEFNLENHRHFVAMQRVIEAANKSKAVEERPLRVARKAKKKPKEKARSRQPNVKEDVSVAAPQPNINESTGYGGFMSSFSSNFLPHATFVNTWWNVLGAPNLPAVVPPQSLSQLPVVSQSHIIGQTIASRPPANLCESPAKPYVIYDPLPNDVLMGRGKPIQERPGNVRFREMLHKRIDKYEQCEGGFKSKSVSAYIVRILKEEGGRFLKELDDGAGWVEVDEATARTKVSHLIRSRRRHAFQATPLKNGKSTA